MKYIITIEFHKVENYGIALIEAVGEIVGNLNELIELKINDDYQFYDYVVDSESGDEKDIEITFERKE